jgi:hypothetical protein
MAPKYDVSATAIDGNAFSIMAAVTSALRKEGVGQEEIEQYLSESMSADYTHLVGVAMKWVRLETD